MAVSAAASGAKSRSLTRPSQLADQLAEERFSVPTRRRYRHRDLDQALDDLDCWATGRRGSRLLPRAVPARAEHHFGIGPRGCGVTTPPYQAQHVAAARRARPAAVTGVGSPSRGATPTASARCERSRRCRSRSRRRVLYSAVPPVTMRPATRAFSGSASARSGRSWRRTRPAAGSPSPRSKTGPPQRGPDAHPVVVGVQPAAAPRVIDRGVVAGHVGVGVHRRVDAHRVAGSRHVSQRMSGGVVRAPNGVVVHLPVVNGRQR